MIGTPIQATLWRVAYRYRKAADPNSVPPPPVEPGLMSALASAVYAEATGPFHQGNVLVLTADATGGDLLPVVERALTAQGVKGSEFSLLAVERMADTVRGLALLEHGAS